MADHEQISGVMCSSVVVELGDFGRDRNDVLASGEAFEGY